jgi:hypothetical protein
MQNGENLVSDFAVILSLVDACPENVIIGVPDPIAPQLWRSQSRVFSRPEILSLRLVPVIKHQELVPRTVHQASLQVI